MFVVTPTTTPHSGTQFLNSIARLIKKNILKPVDRTSATLRDIAPVILQASSAAIPFIDKSLPGTCTEIFPAAKDAQFYVMFNSMCTGVKI